MLTTNGHCIDFEHMNGTHSKIWTLSGSVGRAGPDSTQPSNVLMATGPSAPQWVLPVATCSSQSQPRCLHELRMTISSVGEIEDYDVLEGILAEHDWLNWKWIADQGKVNYVNCFWLPFLIVMLCLTRAQLWDCSLFELNVFMAMRYQVSGTLGDLLRYIQPLAAARGCM